MVPDRMSKPPEKGKLVRIASKQGKKRREAQTSKFAL